MQGNRVWGANDQSSLPNIQDLMQMKKQGPVAHKARAKLFLSPVFSLPAVVFLICYLMSERGG